MFPSSLTLLSLLSASVLTSACAPPSTYHNWVKREHADLARRAAASSSVTSAAYISSTASGHATKSKAAAATSSIATSTVPTYAAGSVPTGLAGAPGLPALTSISAANFPPLDKRPPLNSPQMQSWLEEAELDSVPVIGLTGVGGCGNATFNADAISKAGPDDNCWWTCGGCTRDADVDSCMDKMHFGVSFDDGPSPNTPRLLAYLAEHDIKATFFVVGSRAISYPNILQAIHQAGHQISVHTWSHPAMTTISNEEIVAELGWTREVIKTVTGVSPTTWRPPYGDIDDRVRYIALKLGMSAYQWTVDGTLAFDTQDGEVEDPSFGVTAETVVANVRNFYSAAESRDAGFVVLAHDLYASSVDLAVNQWLPLALNYTPKMTVEPVITCQKEDLTQAYVETWVESADKDDNSAAESRDDEAVVIAQQAGSLNSSSSSSHGKGKGKDGDEGSAAAGRSIALVASTGAAVMMGLALLA
ncbi:hypothetical protein JCM11641_002533 [Rhodosporidiobolus odoratus]